MISQGPNPHVYFVRRVDGEGPVKIGSSGHPAARLSSLMTWAPYPLEIAAQYPGGLNVEHQFHALFADQHSHREWFHPSAFLNKVIADLSAGTFDASILPSGKQLPRRRREQSAAQKEAFALKLRLTARTNRIGLEAPRAVKDAEWLVNGASGEERARCVAVITEYLSDPLRFGTPMPYPWARERLAAYCRRQRVPIPPRRKAA